jgi:hypothetical protein
MLECLEKSRESNPPRSTLDTPTPDKSDLVNYVSSTLSWRAQLHFFCPAFFQLHISSCCYSFVVVILKKLFDALQTIKKLLTEMIEYAFTPLSTTCIHQIFTVYENASSSREDLNVHYLTVTQFCTKYLFIHLYSSLSVFMKTVQTKASKENNKLLTNKVIR